MKLNREYFNKRREDNRIVLILMEHYHRLALFYKWIYNKTGWKWAKERNNYYVTEGTNLGIANLIMTAVDFQILEKYCKNDYS